MSRRAGIFGANGDSLMKRYKCLQWWSGSHDGPLLDRWGRSADAAAGKTEACDVVALWEVTIGAAGDDH